MNYPLKFVQILRGFAAIAVLLFHAGIYTQLYFNNALFTFEYGNLGVDFFFTLSGFIITYIHLKDIKGKGSVKKFLAKRFIRIFPFYWLTLVAVVALDPSSFHGWNLFIQNLLLFRLPMREMPLNVAWSLTYEIVFYMLFSCAIAGGWKTAGIMLAIWVLLIVFSPPAEFGFIEVIVSNLNIEFLFGCLAGYIFIEKKPVLKAPVFLAGLIFIIILIIGSAAWFGFDRFSIIMTTLMGATAGWIILHAALLDRLQRFRAYALPVLVLAGDASYAIYLTHTVYMPYVFKGFLQMLDMSAFSTFNQALIVVFIILFSVSAGIVIHLVIEKPLLVFLRRRIYLSGHK